MMQIVKSSVGVMKTDSGGEAQLPSLPSGTYYVFGLNKVNAEAILWHAKTDLGLARTRCVWTGETRYD